MASTSDAQVLVKFVTKLPTELRVPETPMAVPTSVKRLAMSRIINHLLNLDPVRPFDFLVDGELLRFSLEKHLLDHGLSAESVLEVEYVPAVAPPEQQHCAPHDDWVSAVAGISGGRVVSGSCDGVARVWNADAVCTSSFLAHKAGVTAVACVPSTSSGGSSTGGSLVMTAGKDHLVKLWQLSDEGSEGGRLVAVCSGHTDAVEGLAVGPGGQLAASCGWDSTITVWRTGTTLVDQQLSAAPGPGSLAGDDGGGAGAAGKRRKTAAGSGASASGAAAIQESSVSVMKGHLHCVSSVCWPDSHVLYSGGWDHSVRRWDVEVGVNTDTYNGSKAVYCVAAPPASATASADGALVAFGGADRCLRLWDVRGKASGEVLGVKALAPHAGWVVAAAWCPDSAFHIVTASHDHSLKLWDIRTAVPLATLQLHTDKVLCAAWLQGQGGRLGRIASGGADCTLRLYDCPSYNTAST